jgi:hypothetical protein
MADALDLRHRLPQLWSRVRAGQLRGWRARRVAVATRELTMEQAGQVDAAVAGYITALPWSRFEALLEAKVIEADPQGADLAAREAEADRFVRAGRTNEHGLKLLVAKVAAVDVIWFVAMVNRIADILAGQSVAAGVEPEPVGVRRSRAVGVLAQPALALQLLCAAEGDLPDAPGERELGRRETTAADPTGSPADSTAYARARRRPDPTDADRPAGDDDPADPETTYPHASNAVGTRAGPIGKSGPGDPGWDEMPGREPDEHRTAVIVPSGVDPARLRPPVTIYIHLSATALAGATGPCEGGGSSAAGVARIEDVGPVTMDQVRRFLGPGSQVTVRPLLDPVGVGPIDGYEVPARLREALHLRTPADCFPFGTSVSRRQDLDHTVAYRPPEEGGPPGQTNLGNLGPLTRQHHRVKTHGRWQVRQPDPGSYLWRSPTGFLYLVTADGTHPLGCRPFAQAIWRAATQDGRARAPRERAVGTGSSPRLRRCGPGRSEVSRR